MICCTLFLITVFYIVTLSLMYSVLLIVLFFIFILFCFTFVSTYMPLTPCHFTAVTPEFPNPVIFLLYPKVCGCCVTNCTVSDCCTLMCADKCCTDLMHMAKEARKHKLGPLHPAYNLLQLVQESLLEKLPEDAHLRVSGKLSLSLTRVSDGRNLLVSQFDSREELIQVNIWMTLVV